MGRNIRKSVLFLIYPFALTVKLAILFVKIIQTAYANRKIGKNIVFGEVIKQTYFTGVQAIWIVTILSVIIGIVAGLEISVLLAKIGNPALINKIFFDLVIRELAPLATAMIIVGRTGTAVAVELAILVVNKELETYRTLGINVNHFLLYPRIFGITISTIALSSYFAAVSIVTGAFLVYIQSGVPFSVYLARIAIEGQYMDIIIFFIKSVLNGVVISIISCYIGLRVRPSLTEIPRAASSAVIYCGFAIIILSGIITFLTYA
jgi:phospholipid/cholesterol/gamma-HCH transport system permease protein